MQDIIKDPFEEYIRQSDPDKRALGYAWYTAIGLQDIEPQKQDIGPSKQDIFIPAEIGNKTKQHILSLFYEYGYEKFFGRSEVMQLLGITASPASALIKKMIDSGIIYPIKGKGKGKYLFR